MFTSPSDLLTRHTPIRQTIGEQCHVRLPDFEQFSAPHDFHISENMATHRANSLLAILPNALETGYSEIDPEPVPLKVRMQPNQPRVGLR